MKPTDAMRGAQDGLAGGLEHVRNDLSSLRRQMAHLMHDGSRDAGRGASEAAGAIGAGLRSLSGAGRASATDAYEQVSRFVTRRPVTSIAIAVGVGVLALGLWSLRDRRD